MTSRTRRKLAAIVAADVVGWSRLMGADEVGTLTILKKHRREVIDPRITEFGGRIANTAGDSLLVEFPSAVDAVQCSVEIQQEMAGRNAGLPQDQQMMFRIGINLGDVIADGEDVFGDGVNVAARLEASAEPGGVVVSDTIHEQTLGKLAFPFEDGGLQQFKNIDRPIRTWRWTGATDTSSVRAKASPQEPKAADERPAIAVVPFNNMSASSDEDYFSDGLTEDIITALTYWRSFNVIARNSSFAYKGKSFDVRNVGRELGARYVLEGSVRKQESRVRATAQLIDCENGHHVWAEKFDRDLEDIFQMQDEIVQAIASVVAPQLDRAELERSALRKPEDLDAWTLCLRAKPLVRRRTAESSAQARALFSRAIELQPDFSEAHAGLAMSHNVDAINGDCADIDQTLKQAMNAARMAVAHDDASAWAHHELSTAYQLLGLVEDAIAEAGIAVRLNPNDAYTLHALGNKSDLAGDVSGISHMERAQALCPEDASSPTQLAFLARAYLVAGDYAASVRVAREAIRKDAGKPASHYILALGLGMQGDTDGARGAIAECDGISPGFVEGRRDWQPYSDSACNARLAEIRTATIGI